MISQDNALRNAHRRRLYEILIRSPGMNVASLAEAAGVPHMVAHYHLCVLEQHRLVVGCGNERPRLFFPVQERPQDAAAVQVLSHPARAAVARALAARPQGSTYVQLANLVGSTERRVRYHIRRLLRARLAQGTRTRPRRFTATPALVAHLRHAGETRRLTPSAPPSPAAR